jgi:hypothetical protein
VISHLTAAGVAKINADICKGIPLAITLRQLQATYAKLKHRWNVLIQSLSEEGQAIVGLLRRPPTLGELTMITSFTTQEIQQLLHFRFTQADEFESHMEELAVCFKTFQIQKNAEVVSKAVGLPFSLTQLAPVTDEDCFSGEYASIQGTLHPKKVCIGPDPVNSWFDGNLHEELQVSCYTPIQRSYPRYFPSSPTTISTVLRLKRSQPNYPLHRSSCSPLRVQFSKTYPKCCDYGVPEETSGSYSADRKLFYGLIFNPMDSRSEEEDWDEIIEAF